MAIDHRIIFSQEFLTCGYDGKVTRLLLVFEERLVYEVQRVVVLYPA